MRNQRLLILGLLIAAALLWVYLVYPSAPKNPPMAATRAAVSAPAAPPPVVAAPPPAAPAAPPTVEPAAPPPEAATPATAAVAEEPAEDPPAAVETPATPPADADKAADLFADLLAKQETEPDEGHLPNPARDLWKRFQGEQKDDSWASAANDHLQDALDAWIGDLPEDMGGHVALVHVECRATLCQVLAADNDQNGQADRAGASQEWQQALASLREQSWWNETGFSDMTTQVLSSGGYTLYTTYLLRTPPSSSPPPAS